MKKILLSAAVLSMIFIACEKDDKTTTGTTTGSATAGSTTTTDSTTTGSSTTGSTSGGSTTTGSATIIADTTTSGTISITSSSYTPKKAKDEINTTNSLAKYSERDNFIQINIDGKESGDRYIFKKANFYGKTGTYVIKSPTNDNPDFFNSTEAYSNFENGDYVNFVAYGTYVGALTTTIVVTSVDDNFLKGTVTFDYDQGIFIKKTPKEVDRTAKLAGTISFNIPIILTNEF